MVGIVDKTIRHGLAGNSIRIQVVKSSGSETDRGTRGQLNSVTQFQSRVVVEFCSLSVFKRLFATPQNNSEQYDYILCMRGYVDSASEFQAGLRVQDCVEQKERNDLD